MDFVKKNYEKVILGVVLLGLVAVLYFLFTWVSSEKDALAEKTNVTVSSAAKPLDPLNQDDLLKGIKPVGKLDFSMTNRLFNPVEWQKTPDGRRIKIVRGDEVGIRAVVVTNISPLYLTITLDSVIPHDTGDSYGIGVQDDSAATPYLRSKKPVYLTVGGKSPLFTVTGVKGTAEAPEVSLMMADTGKTVVISKAKPYQQVNGYMADLKYDPERLAFHRYRVGMPLTIAREAYKIVVITDSEVVVSATSNDKRTTITYTKP
jgi:hypothetical protein